MRVRSAWGTWCETVRSGRRLKWRRCSRSWAETWRRQSWSVPPYQLPWVQCKRARLSVPSVRPVQNGDPYKGRRLKRKSEAERLRAAERERQRRRARQRDRQRQTDRQTRAERERERERKDRRVIVGCEGAGAAVAVV
eukprot:2758979-Rhodomonas_salina.1